MAFNDSSFVITGIPGSGKTVLLSALIHSGDRFWPLNEAAQDFLDEAEKLKQQQWPPANDPLAPSKPMHWDYIIKNKKHHLFVSDCAGEAWEGFVKENQEPSLRSSNQLKDALKRCREQLRPQDQEELENIETQFKMASCVCIMIDLAEDINVNKNVKQKHFITAVMNFLEKAGCSKCSIALVVTKCKTYGNRSDWEERFHERYSSVVQKHWKGRVKVIYTDAVADTIVNDEGELVPAPDFSSYGLDELRDWIAEQIGITKTKRSILRIVLFGFCFVILAVLVYSFPLWIVIILAGLFFYCKQKNK